MNIEDCKKMITAQHTVIHIKNKLINALQNRIILLENSKRKKKGESCPKVTRPKILV